MTITVSQPRRPSYSALIFISITVWAIFSLAFRFGRHAIATLADSHEPRRSEDDLTDILKPLEQQYRESFVVEDHLASHYFRRDGLVEVNPSGPHPIHELIRRNERLWDLKLQRASKTIDEAVREYKRRYHRRPPRGFDLWWKFVVDNNVQLPDEYDQIHQDLQPFWGVHPMDLQRLQREWETHRDTITIGKQSDLDFKLRILSKALPDDHATFMEENAIEYIELLQPFARHLPTFRAVFSPHDNPNLLSDWELRGSLLEAASVGTHVNIDQEPSVKLNGWAAACSPNSLLRRPSNTATPIRKTFIHDHKLSMNPCLHPELLNLHGQYVSHPEGAGPIPERKPFPQFSHCKTLLHSDILPTSPGQWVEDVSDKSWEEKSDERLYWRGSNTGIWHDTDTRWRLAQRIRFVNGTNILTGNVTVLPSLPVEYPVGDGEMYSFADVNPSLTDVAFGGRPLSCPNEYCAELQKELPFKQYDPWEHAATYKYVMDVDGNGWSGRFQRLMTTRSVVFKSTIYPEWFSDRLMPWVHYVPIKVDYEDLYDALLFFRGHADGSGRNDGLARKIGQAGRDWSRSFWRRVDMQAYLFRLMLEYGRVMNLERDDMYFDL